LLEGRSIDWTSGIALVEISLDEGKTWIAVGKSSSWSTTLNSVDLKIPDGPLPVLARALDKACNQEHTARVVVNIDNTPPDISMGDPINIMGRSTTVNTFDAGSGVDHGLVTISGNGIQPREIGFAAGQTEVDWDGLAGDGRTAPFGVFGVTVDVWDKVGNHSNSGGFWVRPEPEKPAAVIAPTAVPPAIEDAAELIVPEEKTELPKALPFWSLVLPLGAMGVWLAGSNIAIARDRRWSELRGIRQVVARYLDQKKTNFPEEGEDD
jgi:hypothetical protein